MTDHKTKLQEKATKWLEAAEQKAIELEMSTIEVLGCCELLKHLLLDSQFKKDE